MIDNFIRLRVNLIYLRAKSHYIICSLKNHIFDGNYVDKKNRNEQRFKSERLMKHCCYYQY